MPITLKQMRYFVSIVECGSISGCARSLNVAQTAIGAQIHLLEERLGISLLVRSAQGVKATAAGQHLYARAVEIIERIEETKREVAQFGGEIQHDLFVGLAPSLRAAIGHELLNLQPSELPGSSLFLRESMREHLLEDLRSGVLDYVIAHAAAQQPGLRATPVLRQPLLLVTAPGKDPCPGPVPFLDVLRRPLALNAMSSVTASALEREAGARGVALNVAYRTDSESALKQIIMQGMASGILPAELVASEVAAGRLATHPIVDPSLDITAFFVVREASVAENQDQRLLRLLERLLDEHSANCTCQRLERIFPVVDGMSE